jgi:EAL domain-containing protein (putative c-di-GMP-specific phosphodiesterase class I)
VIVRAVLGLGRSLGMSVVAEGVETDAQMRFLAAEACDEAQGYLISKPQPIEHFAEQIGAREGFVAPGRPDAAVA